MQLSDTCPVCGMRTKEEISSVEHRKMYFHFCSVQCREMFVAHPNLYNIKAAGKDRSEILKRRTMRLAKPLGEVGAELLIPCLEALMGVKEVMIEGDKVHISYDLLQVTESQIEKVLVDVGVQLGDDWLERLRRGWVHDCEDNELDNLAAPPELLPNRAPPGAGRK